MFEQQIIDSDQPGTVCIVGILDGVEVWRSYLEDDIDPAIRLNFDHPTATDLRSE